jgi:predicted DCC family thiol-disulfide oxidoreductase YuxK
MISLSSEMTDSKGRRARAGWVFFDADCSFCVSTARWLAQVIEPRGFALAPLLDPRVRVLLDLPEEQLLSELRLLTRDGRQFGGADALLRLCREVWWAWPLYALAWVPGVKSLVRAAYRSFAARRACVGGMSHIVPAPKDWKEGDPTRRQTQ